MHNIYYPVGNCTGCGSPIYGPSEWDSSKEGAPRIIFTCPSRCSSWRVEVPLQEMSNNDALSQNAQE
jgi:hypothetical protein